MRKIIYILASLLLLGMIACKSDKSKDSNGLTQLMPLKDTEEVSELLSYIRNFQIVTIPESQNTIFQQIYKVILDKNGNIYPLEYQSDRLRVLNPDGSLKRTVAVKGQGPKEYLSARDLALTFDEKTIAYLDNQLILLYGTEDTTSYRSIQIKCNILLEYKTTKKAYA